MYGNDLTTLAGVEKETMDELYYGSRSNDLEMLQYRNNFRNNRVAFEAESKKIDKVIRRKSTIFNRRKIKKMRNNLELVVIGLSDEEVEKIKEYQGIASHEI